MAFSLRARLIAWYSALLLLALASFIAVVLWVHWRLLLRQYDEELETLAVMATHVVEEEMGEHSDLKLAVDDMEGVVHAPGHVVKAFGANSQPLSTRGAAFPFSLPGPGFFATPGVRTVTATDGGAWRLLVRENRIGEQRYFTVIGAPLDEITEQWQSLVKASTIGLPFVLLFGGLGGWWLARHGLLPLTTMAAQARDITARTADSRLQVPRFGDELSHLAESFNHVLDRLSAALAEQRRFMADASHELRTPVSIIRTATEVTLSQPARDAAEYAEALEAIGQQSARLARLVDDMLVLARADAGGYPITMSTVDLSALAHDSVRDLALQAAERQIIVACDAPPGLYMAGDEMLVRRVFSNLLHNAIAYTPIGGHVTVSLEAVGDVVELRVRDSGPGIPEADQRRIFERFVRLDSARAGGGAGLGLAIARWIVEAHGGALSLVESGPSGSVFAARFTRLVETRGVQGAARRVSPEPSFR